jgi:LPXTG-motif cell wall-anchored protein
VNQVKADFSNYVASKGRIKSADSENALVDITVLNSKSFLLPKTGGTSLYVVTILGVFVIAVGCFLAFGKRKSK